MAETATALINFCENPEEDPDNIRVYDFDRLRDLVQDFSQSHDGYSDAFVEKVLQDFGWDHAQSDFQQHYNDDEGIDTMALAMVLKNKSTVPKFVGIRFCSECNNMLAPMEKNNEESGEFKLVYTCKYCRKYEEDADNNCTYVSRAIQEVDNLAQINADVRDDPTLPHEDDIECPKCSVKDAVFFQAQSHRDQSNMKLYYVCTACHYKWQADTTDY